MLTAGIFTKLKNARVKRGTITTSVLASRLYRRKVANWIQQGDDHPLDTTLFQITHRYLTLGQESSSFRYGNHQSTAPQRFSPPVCKRFRPFSCFNCHAAIFTYQTILTHLIFPSISLLPYFF